jgi:hypothetical protein
MAGISGLIGRFARAVGVRPAPQLDETLAGMERIFHAPPLTPDLVAAFRLIAPHFDFTPGERDRKIWEADQNGSCWGEYLALAPLLEAMPKPQKVLEIGPGLGRSIVFFSKKLGWQDAEIHAYEGDGSTTQYTVLGPRLETSFCGNIQMLRHVLEYNAVRNVTIFDAKEVRLPDLPGPYDLLYSFYCIGFHWSLEHFLDDLVPLLHDKSIAIFTVPNEFAPFARLEALSYKIIDWKTAWPKEARLKLLVLSKGSLPT